MTIVKRIGDHDLPLPKQESLDAAGYDLRSTICVTLYPGQRLAIPTGFAWQIPMGMVGLVRPRSGLAVRDGLDVLAGVIDADFRGEVRAVLINHGDRPVTIAKGERIAQLVITNYYSGPLREVDDLPKTERGEGAFGSTGQQ
jgi:dUTP pyrophosphatase